MDYLSLEREKIPALADQMNQLLSNYQVYYQKLRNFHWNVRGENFFELHREFEDMYKDAQLKIDEIAERILVLKYRPISLWSKYLEMSEIKEVDAFVSDRDMVKMLLSDHGILIRIMRSVLKKADAAGDEGTIDMIGGYLNAMEKRSWMLDAWLSSTKTVKNESYAEAMEA